MTVEDEIDITQSDHVLCCEHMFFYYHIESVARKNDRITSVGSIVNSFRLTVTEQKHSHGKRKQMERYAHENVSHIHC